MLKVFSLVAFATFSATLAGCIGGGPEDKLAAAFIADMKQKNETVTEAINECLPIILKKNLPDDLMEFAADHFDLYVKGVRSYGADFWVQYNLNRDQKLTDREIIGLNFDLMKDLRELGRNDRCDEAKAVMNSK